MSSTWISPLPTIPYMSEFTCHLIFPGGITSGWFCLESSILTLAISATAFSFYRHCTMQKARRMFHASLLYLPVFMSGLLFHRLNDNEHEQTMEEDSSGRLLDGLIQEDRYIAQKTKMEHSPSQVSCLNSTCRFHLLLTHLLMQMLRTQELGQKNTFMCAYSNVTGEKA